MQSLDVDLERVHALLPDISALGERLNDFNIFDLLGTAHLELAHSHVLEFLLDSSRPHSLGSQFAELLIGQLQVRNPQSKKLHALNARSFLAEEVRRERHDIDLLVIDRTNQIVILIENKIHSDEHSNQLERYLEQVEDEFSAESWTTIPIYLTLRGEMPSNRRFFDLDYRTVAYLVERLAAEIEVESAVRITLEHYARMIRRHLVGDWDTAAEAKKLCDLAPEAFEYIVARKFYPRQELQQLISLIVGSTPGLIKEPEEDINRFAQVAYIRFTHPIFDRLDAFDPPGSKQKWTASRRIPLFQFDISDKRVFLGLVVGPGPTPMREDLFEIARNAGTPFDFTLRADRAGDREWRWIYGTEFVGAVDFQDLDIIQLEERIRAKWVEFLTVQLGSVIAPFEAATSQRGA